MDKKINCLFIEKYGFGQLCPLLDNLNSGKIFLCIMT